MFDFCHYLFYQKKGLLVKMKGKSFLYLLRDILVRGVTMLCSIFYCVHIDYNRCMKQKSGDVMDNIRIHYSKNDWREEWWKMLSINMQSS